MKQYHSFLSFILIFFAAVVLKKSDGNWNLVPDPFYTTFRPNSSLSPDFK